MEAAEDLTDAQFARRTLIMVDVIQRYRWEKRLPALSDDALRAETASYDRQFTYAGIPTASIPTVYNEAMRAHGQYLLRVDDYLRAWDRIKPQEGGGVDLSLMNARGYGCTICRGTGMTKVFLPKEGIEIEKECPYHCKVVTALEVTR